MQQIPERKINPKRRHNPQHSPKRLGLNLSDQNQDARWRLDLDAIHDPETRISYWGRRIGVIATVAAGVVASLVATGNLSLPEGPKLPTVKEYDADPGKYPGHTKINLSSTNPWEVAEKYMPDRDPREASDMIVAEDNKNNQDGIGRAGFTEGDPLIVERPPAE